MFRVHRVRGFAVCAFLLFAASAFPASFTSVQSGDWGDSNTWGGSVPVSGDTVTITSNHVVTVTDLRVIETVTLDGTAGNKMLVIDSTGSLLVESAPGPAVTISAPSAGSTNIVRMNGGQLETSGAGTAISITGGAANAAKLEFTSLGGVAKFAGDIVFAGTAANALIDFGPTGGTVEIGGDLGSGGTFANNTGATVEINGTGAQTINGYTFNHLTVNKAGGTATLNGAITVNGDFTISTGVLDDGGNQISLNGGGTSSVNIGSTGVLKLGSAASATLFPSPFSSYAFNPGSSVVYQAGMAQTIDTAVNYENLWLSTMGGAVSKTLSGALLNINGQLDIWDNGASTVTLDIGGATVDLDGDLSGDGTVSLTTGQMSIEGNFSSSASLNAGTSQITYDGPGAQSVLAATYHNLTVNKPSGTATLAGNIAAADLAIVDGDLNAGSNTITLTGDLSVAAGSTFFSSNTTLVLSGTSLQTLTTTSGHAFGTLTVNNPAGVSLAGPLTDVLNALNLNGGNITTASEVFVDVLATVTRTSGWIVGPLKMGLNPAPARTFHVGTSAAYLPVTIDADIPGTIVLQAAEGQHPDRTGARVLGRYWQITSGTVTSLDSITFQYNLTDVVTGTEADFILSQYDTGAFLFTHYGSVNAVAHTASATSVSAYTTDWLVGHPGSLAAASQLSIASINGGTDPQISTPFNVVVESLDDNGDTAAVFVNTSFSLSEDNGTGTLGGTLTGTINAGTDTTTVTGVTYDAAETGLQLRATRTAGDDLTDGTLGFDVTAAPSTLTVTNLLDSGVGSLRDAINTANTGACSTPCTIEFSVAGEIMLSSPLPAIIASDLTIDGYSAPGSMANTNAFGLPSNATITMAINGGGSVNFGFDVQETFVKIQGFAIKNFGNAGVRFTGDNSGSKVTGCYIGTDLSGTVAAPNAGGVLFSSSAEAGAGGTLPADRNVISGNTFWGITVDGTSNTISLIGNYVGTRADLGGALPNVDGIIVQSGTSSIGIGGGSVGNVVSGNSATGVILGGSGATLVANRIGTAGSANTAIANSTGVYINAGGSSNTIGGASPSDINVISGNGQNGILIHGNGNTVDNNYIGIAPDGVTALGNGSSGIKLENTASNNFLGTSFGNKIAFNTNDGVTVTGTGTGNVIRRGKIAGNTNRGIDLGDDGTTNNDATDADTGPNNFQNFPVINEAKYNAGNVDVKVSLDSSGGVSTNFFIFDVYKTDASSPAQAIEYLGNSGCQAGNVFSNLAFSVPAGTAVVGNNVVATATAYSNAGCTTPSEGTSELAAAVRIGGDIHWIAASGAWETAGNWNPATVPTTSDSAYIDNTGTYTVTINSIVNVGAVHVGAASGTQTLNIDTGRSLNLTTGNSSVSANGILSMNGIGIGVSGGALNIAGTFNWNVGSITGAGGVTMNSGSTLNLDTASGKSVNAGSLTVGSGATANWLNGPIAMLNAGFIDNSGLFEIKTDNTISDAGSAGTFDNAGTLRKSTTAGTTNFTNITLNHTAGTIDIQTGTLNVAGGTASAPITISSGATMLVDDNTYTFNTGAGVTGAGKVYINGGTLAVNGPSTTIEHLRLDLGTLGGTGSTLSGANAWEWFGGTMSGGGSTVISSGGSLVIGTASGKALNNRTLTLQSSSTTTVTGSGSINLSNGATIANAGLFDTTVDVTLADGGSDGGITNSGTFSKSGGAGSTTITNIDFVNSGTIDVQTGTFNPGNVTNTGAIQLATGTLFVDDGIVDLNTGSDVSGAGLLHIAGGTLTHNENPDTLPNVQLDSGVLNGVSTFDITAFVWNGGTMSGAGTTNIPNAATATIATASAKALQRTFTVAIGGTVNVTGSGTINMSTGGNVFNQGLFDVTTDMTFNDSGSDGGFDNAGTLRKSAGGGQLVFSNVDVNNTSLIEIDAGIFNPVNVTSNGTVDLTGNFLANDGAVVFNGTNDVTGTGLLDIAGATVTANATDIIPNVQLNGGTLNGSAAIDLPSFTWTGGIMSGTGTTTIPSGGTATISGASGKSLQRTLSVVNGGTVNVTGTGAINMANGGNIANDGTIDVTAAVTFNDAGSAGDIANTRIFRSNHAGTTTFSGITLNSSTGAGLIDIPNGAIDLADGTNSAAIAIGSGASFLVNSDSYTLAAGTTVTGAGTVSLTAGTLAVTGNVSVPNFAQTNGTLDGLGTFTITNVGNWSTGSMQGGGTTEVSATGTLNLITPSAKALNNRTLSSVALGTINLSGNGPVNMSNGANIANAGTLLITADNTFSDVSLAGNIVNTGTIRKQTATGPTTLTGIGLTNNGGLIDIQAGTISMTGDAFTQNAGSTLKIWLNGTTPGTGFGQLSSNLNVNLAGTLEIALVGPYQPAGGDTFRVIAAPGHVGDFTQPYTYPVLANSRTFSDAYDGSGLLLTVIGNADLSISKAAPSNVLEGSPISYTLTVTNAGPDTANSVSVTDVLETGHTGISASGTGWSCNVVSLTVTCTVATLNTGTAPAITINATAPASATTFTNVANVSSSNDANAGNNSGSAIVTVDALQAELQLSSTSPALPVAPSTAFSFTFHIANNGPQTASSVTFNAPIPAELTYNSAAPDAGSCNFAGGTVTCNVGSILSGATLNIVLNLTTTATAGTHTVTGNVFATESDPSPANNSVNAYVAVTGSTITVTNTNDGGSGSLREALDDAAGGVCTPLPCTIAFNIPGAPPFVIAPQSNLPAIGSQIVVDATTQPGYAGVPLVEIDGSSASTSVIFTISGTGSTVRGFSLYGDADAIQVTGDGNFIEANYVGLTSAGTAVANQNGIRISGDGNTVGGTTPAQRNVISGNTNAGVITVTGSSGNTVSGNYLGTDPAGTAARPNTVGVQVYFDSANTMVGGPSAAHRNVISGNTGMAVHLVGAGDVGANNTVQNNWIGVDAGGTTLLGSSNGVNIADNTGARVLSNVIAGGNYGVIVMTATGAQILGNAIHDHTILGIELGGTGPTPNDPTDSDTGANGLQNFPTLSTVTLTGGGNVNVAYALDSSGSPAGIGSVRIELFKADAGGDGEALVHSTCVAGNVFNTSLSFNDPSITAGTPIVATATSYTGASCATVADGTSEFSNVVNAATCVPPPVTITGPAQMCAGAPAVTLDAGSGFVSYAWSNGATTQSITVAPGTTASYTVTVTNGLGCTNSDTHTVTVNPLPTVTITGPTATCTGTPVTLDAGAGFAGYAWSNGATTQTITVSPASTTTYTVTVTDGNTCSASDSHTVTVSSNPTATITAPAAVCENSTNNNASVAAQAGATYNWTIGNGTITSGNGTNAITFTAGPSGTVTLGVAVTAGTCTSNGNANVPITAPPVVNITGPATACAGSTVTLDAGAGFATYLWSTGATTQTISVAAAVTQTYSVTVSNLPGCSATDTHTVTVTSAPVATIDAPSPVSPNQANLVASVPVQPGATYAWSITNGTITSGNGTHSIVFTAGASGITHLHVTVTLGGCSASFTQAVFIEGTTEPTTADLAVTKSAPATVQAGATLTYTIGLRNFGPGAASSVVLTDTLPAGTTFLALNAGSWNCTNSGSTITCTGNAPAGTNSTILITVNAPQTAGVITNTVQITSSTPDPNGANNSASASTSVQSQAPECPAAPPSLLQPADNASVNSPVAFSWSAVTGASEYELWLGDALAAVTGSTGATLPLPSGTFDWFVVARFPNGCDPLASAARTVTVLQSSNCSTSTAPQITVPASGTVGSPTTFMWTPVAQAIGYRLWIEANGTAAQDAGTTNGATSLNVDLPSGSIVAYVDALFSGCPPARSAPVQLQVPRPDPCVSRTTAQPISPANGAVVSSSNVEFTWTEAAGADGYRLWYSLDGAPFAVLGSTTSDTSLKAAIGRGTVVWYVETLHDGCASTESQTRQFTIPARNDCTQQRPETISPANGSNVVSPTIQFVWSAVANAVSYELWAAVDNGAAVLLGTTNTTSLTRIVPAGKIDWFVRAIVDRCGARDSQKARFTHTLPDACLENDRPQPVSPLSGASVSTPVRFDWRNVNATKYELFVIRGDAPPQLVATTNASEVDDVNIEPGKVRWFVRAHFGENCPPLDSGERRLEIVSQPNPCSDLAAPVVSAPGQISTGIPFLIQWTPVNGATAYQVLIADNASFTGAAISTVTAPELPYQGANATDEPVLRFIRVRAIDTRCQPASLSPYGPAHVLLVLPKTGGAASAPFGTDSLSLEIELGPQYAGQSFHAAPKQPWITVTPTNGVVPAGGMTLTVAADTSDLPIGTSIGSISVTFGNASGGVSTNDGPVGFPLGVSLVTPVTPTPANTPPPDALIIPAIAHADGINSHFQSDVRVSNTSAQLVTYQLTFTPSGDSGITQGQQTTFSIEPGRTIALDDILKSWFSTGTGSAMGTLEIRPLTQLATSTPGIPLSGLANLASFASSRTFNVTSNGTFGQYIPAIPFANFIGSQRILSLQQIAQSARYRTNLGIVEGSGDPASLIVRMFGAGGEQLGSFPVSLNGGQHVQLNSFLRDHGVADLDDGRVEIEVLSEGGKVTAYASVLDNLTSDPLLVTPVEIDGAGATRWVVPGVADLASGFANWQTDMRLFNAGTEDVEATLTFHSQNGGEAKTANVTIGAGKLRQFNKALLAIFGVTNDGGAVHIATPSPARLIATARTYNQTTGGTYGQFISAVTPNEAAGTGDRPLQLLQVEESDRYRSNVGIVEVTGNPVRLEITAVPPDAKFTAVTELFLGANEFRQFGSLLRSMGLADTHNARVTVRVLDGTGRVTAYASVIDMLTNDPTYIPAQ